MEKSKLDRLRELMQQLSAYSRAGMNFIEGDQLRNIISDMPKAQGTHSDPVPRTVILLDEELKYYAPIKSEAARLVAELIEDMKHLHRKERDAIWLYYVKCLGWQEVAECMDCAERTARAYGHSGKNKVGAKKKEA